MGFEGPVIWPVIYFTTCKPSSRALRPSAFACGDAYVGEWKPKQIPNPAYEDGVQLAAYEKLAHVGFELWIVNNGTIFDNILVCDDIEYAKAQGEKLWRPTSKGEKDVKEKWDKENKPADELDDEGEGEEEDGEEEEEEEEKDEL